MRPDAISLESVIDEPLRFASELAVGLEAIDREPLVAISPLQVSGEVVRIEGGYALSARLVWEGRLECSRCLAAYPFESAEDFGLVLYPRPARADAEVELTRDDLDAFYYDEPLIELSPIAQERVQMALPMKPLCQPDCKGLCVECGKDLNAGPCACAREAADPRWEALRALREKV